MDGQVSERVGGQMEGWWMDDWAGACVGGEENERSGEWADGPGQRHLTSHTHVSLSALILAVILHQSECLSLTNKTVCSVRAGLSLLSHNLTCSSESKTGAWRVLRKWLSKKGLQQVRSGEGRPTFRYYANHR